MAAENVGEGNTFTSKSIALALLLREYQGIHAQHRPQAHDGEDRPADVQLKLVPLIETLADFILLCQGRGIETNAWKPLVRLQGLLGTACLPDEVFDDAIVTLDAIGYHKCGGVVALAGGADIGDENGLVANPLDKNAYREATKIINEHSGIAPNIKALHRILADHQPRIRRWKKNKRRLFVNVGDWLKYVDYQQEHTNVPAKATTLPAVEHGRAPGASSAKPASLVWLCRGCGAEYPDRPEEGCEKCGKSSFEPVMSRPGIAQLQRRK